MSIDKMLPQLYATKFACPIWVQWFLTVGVVIGVVLGVAAMFAQKQLPMLQKVLLLSPDVLKQGPNSNLWGWAVRELGMVLCSVVAFVLGSKDAYIVALVLQCFREFGDLTDFLFMRTNRDNLQLTKLFVIVLGIVDVAALQAVRNA